jgi:hypothetical protein
MVFVEENILTDEKTDCRFLSLKTVREDINFYKSIEYGNDTLDL